MPLTASRHDYMPFGEEIAATVANRNQVSGFTANDRIRQQFTGYERDGESGLDFAQNRYFAARHGRFTSVDPLAASASVKNPQTLNRYSYALNSPYKFTDPLGLKPCGRAGDEKPNGDVCTQADDVHPIDWDTTFGAESARAETEHETRVQNAFDAENARSAIKSGDQSSAEAICANNPQIICERSEESVTVQASIGLSIVSYDDDPFADLALAQLDLRITNEIGLGAINCNNRCEVTNANSEILQYLYRMTRYLFSEFSKASDGVPNDFSGMNPKTFVEHLTEMAKNGAAAFVSGNSNSLTVRKISTRTSRAYGRPYKVRLSQRYLENYFLDIFGAAVRLGMALGGGKVS